MQGARTLQRGIAEARQREIKETTIVRWFIETIANVTCGVAPCGRTRDGTTSWGEKNGRLIQKTRGFEEIAIDGKQRQKQHDAERGLAWSRNSGFGGKERLRLRQRRNSSHGCSDIRNLKTGRDGSTISMWVPRSGGGMFFDGFANKELRYALMQREANRRLDTRQTKAVQRTKEGHEIKTR